MPAFINVSNTWRSIASLRVNVSGTWRTVTNGYVNVAGTWRSFFTSTLTPSIDFPVTLSSTSVSLQDADTATLTGTNYHWNNADSLTFRIDASAASNFSSYTTLSSGSISNPSSGSSNTKTVSINYATFTSSTMYFRFVVIATNSTYSTTATSTSNTVTATYTANTAAMFYSSQTVTSTSISIFYSQNAYLYSYIKEIYGPSGLISSILVDPSSNPATFTGLSPNTSYDIVIYPRNFLGISGTALIVAGVTTLGTAPTEPLNLARSTGNGGSKTFTWQAPASNGGSTITSYQYNLDSLGWFTTSSSTSQSLTLTAGDHVFQVRAVNANGAGTAASTGSFRVPTINSGPSASSITTSSATISWSSSNQSSYTLTISGDDTLYTGTTATSRSITGLSPGTSYTPTLTIRSSTNDTATTTGSAFTTSVSPPVNISAPTISPTSGTAGSTTYSVTSVGSWANSPTSYAYQWQYLDQGSTYLSISGATSSTYFAPSNFFSLGYGSPIRCRVTASNAGGSAAATSNTASVAAPLSPPAGGSVSLSGTGVAGTNITASTSGWSNSPTSYSVRIYASTSNPPTTSDTLKASSSSSSVSYTVTSFDASPPAYYFKAFATATNAAGTSGEVGSNVILSSSGATVPGTVNSLTATSLLSGSNLNWSASWSAPSSNGGSAITGYRVYVERAGSSSGPWIASTTQIPAGSGAYTVSSPYFTSSTSVSGRVTGTAATWIRVWVAAVNSVGTGSYTSADG